MTSSSDSARLAEARAEGESALARLVRLNPPGKVSLAGAYALGYGALGMAQHDDQDWEDEDWFDLLDPLDALVLGAVFPQRFTDVYQFANTRDAWLGLLRDTVHWRGVEAFVGVVMQTSQEFGRPVDDGELMLIIAGRVEDAKLDQRKLPRSLLPGDALADSRIGRGPAFNMLPVLPAKAADLVARFWQSTEIDLDVPHDGTPADALRAGIRLLRNAGMDVPQQPTTLLPALYLALVATDDELLADAAERAHAWAVGLADDSPLVPIVDTLLNGAAQHLTTDDILARLHGVPTFTAPVRREDRVWHSWPGEALRTIAFELGYREIKTRDRKILRISDGVVAMLQAQRERFEHKFGREPAPDEPLFFDPDADEPTPLTRLDLEQSSVAMLEALDICPAWIYAAQHTDGLLPLLDGSFRNPSDRQEWEDTIARYLRTHPETVVDTNEELRKLRMGATATALNMARANPSYATSLAERMREPDTDEFSDASLVRTLLQHWAELLMSRLREDSAVLASAKEHARAWGGAALADTVTQGIDEDPDAVDPAILLAAFAAGGLQTGDEDDEDDDDGEEIDISLEAANVCEQLVEAVLDQHQPDIPRRIITPLLELNNDEGGRLIAMLIAKAMGYLVSMRDGGVTPEQLTTAVNWLGGRFGAEYAGPAAVASSLAGHPEGQDILIKQFGVKEPTMNHLVELLDVDFFPAMIWLCAGMVATAGAGDVKWLHRLRV